jgi:hypothetical protein
VLLADRGFELSVELMPLPLVDGHPDLLRR